MVIYHIFELIKKLKIMPQEEQKFPINVPDNVADKLQIAADSYSKSQYTTNAGMILRFILRFVPVKTVIQAFSHVIAKK